MGIKRLRILFSTAAAFFLSGCGTTLGISAAGGDAVYITDRQDEIANCTPIGNVKLADEHRSGEYGSDNELEFRLRVARLGGNTGLVIAGTMQRPLEGVAFQCGFRAV